MVQNACILHHVTVVQFLLSLPLELLASDLPIEHVVDPAVDFFLGDELTLEAFLVHRANQVVVILLVHLETNGDADYRLEDQSSVHDLPLVIDAESKRLLCIIDKGLAQTVSQVAHVTRPKHVAVVGADRLIQILLDQADNHGENARPPHDQLDR